MSEVPPDPGSLARHRRLALAAGAVVALLVAARVALPYALASVVASQAESRFGLVASVRNVDLGLFAGELVVDGLSVAPPSRAPAEGAPLAPGEALLAWERARVNLDWTALLRGELRLTELALDGARVRVERQPDGRIDVFAGAEPPDEPETPTDAASAPEDGDAGEGADLPIFIDALDLEDARLRLVEARDGGDIVELALAGLLLRDVSLVDGAFGLGGIDLREPVLEVDRERLLAPPARADAPSTPSAEPAAPPEADTNTAPRHRIDELDVERAELTLRVGEREVAVALQLHLEDFAFETGATAPIRLGVEIEGGSIDLDGRFGALPPFFDGAVRWKDLPVPVLALVVRPDLGDWIERCRSTGETEVELRTAETSAGEAGPGLRVTGRFDIAGFAAANPGDPEVAVAWENLDVSLRELVVPLRDPDGARAPIRVHAGAVTLTAPDVLYTRPSTALETLLEGPAEDAAPATPATPAEPGEDVTPTTPPPPDIRVDQLAVRGGHVTFHDRAVSPPVSSEVRALEVDVANLALPGAKTGDLRVAATLVGGSLLEVKGHTRANLAGGDVDVKLERLPLPPVNAYLAGAGLAVTRGSLSLATRAHDEGAAWKLDNHLTLHDFDLDPAGSTGFRDQVGLPLGTVLALLRDPGGDITLTVPLSLQEGSLDVGVTGVVVTALREALVGAASSPLKVVGGVLHGDGELGLEPLPAQPGRAALAEGADARVTELANLLEGRPTLGVTLAGRAGKKDRDALAEQMLAERAAAGEAFPELEDAPGFLVERRVRGALEARAAGKVGPLDADDEVALARWRDAVEVSPERFAALAHARADVAQDALRATGRVDAARVEQLAPAKRGAPGVVLGFREIPRAPEAAPPPQPPTPPAEASPDA